ncbi:Phosphoenolpyruvate/pyruvate domain-containing protein [Marasmius fiardii PR-910]|nr:Phosphoenolpyruvate/pyruvate domain-containing protein [Marasmius fiardii PR-910]
MSANSLIDAFKANKTTFGVFVTNGGFYHARTVVQASPHIDWIVIDCEHGLTALNPGVADQVAAIQAEGKPALVRIPATGASTGTSWQIKYCLDAGAKGVIVPMVSTPEKAAEAAADCRFPPVGRRGFGSAYVHTSWNMPVQEYLAKANDNVLCFVQIETKEGMENLEKIAAVDGVDVLLLGPFDLSMAYGYPVPNPDPHPEVEIMIQRVKDVAHAHGKKCMMYVGTGEQAARRAKEGFDMVSLSNDAAMLQLGLKSHFADAVRLSQ